jgi:nucleoid DNA-binding protein
MKKITLFFIAIFTVSFSQDEKISIDDLVNIKWKMKRYITKSRVGRNPKTKVEYKIQTMEKIKFKAASSVKKLLN